MCLYIRIWLPGVTTFFEFNSIIGYSGSDPPITLTSSSQFPPYTWTNYDQRITARCIVTGGVVVSVARPPPPPGYG